VPVNVAAEQQPLTEGQPASDLLATSAAGPAAVRGGALRVGGYMVGMLVNAVSAALLFRHLGRVDTGRYVLALSLVAIVAALSDLGLTAVGVREMSMRTSTERWQVARDLLGLRIALTLLGGAAVTAIAAWGYSGVLAAGVALACVGLLLQAMQDNFVLSLTVGLRLGWVAALDFTRQLLTALTIVLLVLAGAGLLPFFTVSIPVGMIVLTLTLRLVRGTRALSPTFDWGRWRPLVSAILPYSAAVAAAAVYFRVSILLLSALSNSYQVGYFGTSFRIIEVLTILPALLIGAALPIFARAAHGDHTRFGYALERVFEVSLLAGAWVAVSIAVSAPLAIALIGGPAFAPAAPVLAIQGVALGAMFVSVVWANALLSLGLYRRILWISLAMLALGALLVTVLAPIDGARGAAIGTAIAEIVAAGLQALAVVRGRPDLRPSLRVVPRVVLAAAVGLTPLALTGLPVILRLALSTFLYGIVVLALRALPNELLSLLPDRLARRGPWRAKEEP
jgi:O-antigen/teichoic acid export membrane protein